ncbi:MAG: hypothetical protein NTV86_18470 [Planctomycetota bacterium]|nr:hypothetical protein [Planctomycetota bacterium]
MPTQVFTVAKIVGKGGQAVLRSIRRWAALRDEPTGSWPVSCRRKADAFGDLLRDHATEPPVVFFGEYVDTWWLGPIAMLLESVGLGAVAGEFAEVWADKYMLACYALPDGGRLCRALRAAKRRKLRTQEAGWAIDVLQNALTAWEDLAPESTIVLFRRTVGPSVLDSQVVASGRTMPAWCAKLAKAPPARASRRGGASRRRSR